MLKIKADSRFLVKHTKLGGHDGEEIVCTIQARLCLTLMAGIFRRVV